MSCVSHWPYECKYYIMYKRFIQPNIVILIIILIKVFNKLYNIKLYTGRLKSMCTGMRGSNTGICLLWIVSCAIVTPFISVILWPLTTVLDMSCHLYIYLLNSLVMDWFGVFGFIEGIDSWDLDEVFSSCGV